MKPTLGASLRRLRERLGPGDVGLAVGSHRRAPGLRREELAEPAGISVDYLVRLEQGRADHPSAPVVASLARALQLDRAERNLFFRAAGLPPPADGLNSDTCRPACIASCLDCASFPWPCSPPTGNWSCGTGSGSPSTATLLGLRTHSGTSPAPCSSTASTGRRSERPARSPPEPSSTVR